ncbi:B12-binding domain-containing radical SAM protein [bacterium]|nr:B12-binding domain-containing radical SAM protein [bacterium]
MPSKIVVANSVGVDRSGRFIIHSPSRWTTSVTKNPFTWYPWELAYLSSLLKRETDCVVKFVDGCLEQLDTSRYAEKIIAEKPDYLIMESSTRTIRDDMNMAIMVKKATGTKLVFCGPHPSVFPEETLQTADYVCQGEFEMTVLELLQGKDPSTIAGLYPNPRRKIIKDINILPWPEDDDVKRIDYGNPGVPGTNYLEIQMYASRGCPFQCNFCVCGNLYYDRPNWRPRNIEDVMAEISYLKKKYPELEGVFFDEESHNQDPKHFDRFLDAIIDHGHDDLHYVAMGSYASLNPALIRKMKRAGYYQMRIGNETASQAVADGIGLKGKFDLNLLKESLRAARDEGLEIYGTFIFGARGSTEAEDQKTIDLMQEIIREHLLTELQVSIATPQPGTPFYNWVDENDYLVTKNWEDYDGGCGSVVCYPDYSKEQIDRQFQKAVDIGRVYRGLQEARRDGWIKVFKRAHNRVGTFGIFRAGMNVLKSRLFDR